MFTVCIVSRLLSAAQDMTLRFCRRVEELYVTRFGARAIVRVVFATVPCSALRGPLLVFHDKRPRDLPTRPVYSVRLLIQLEKERTNERENERKREISVSVLRTYVLLSSPGINTRRVSHW